MEQSRKRRRDDLSCDLTSLSKRFRDLHLDLNGGGCNSIISIGNHLTKIDYTVASKCSTGCPAAAYNEYNPELGIDQNPGYYEKNKVLFDLHAERVRRHCHCTAHN
ncbi:uncharacterized protein [Drosophila kikkawai]|uniref:Uncharacterized protein n=1 Tax=Drosophila kikkawai TaxID=30033 RepID=A0A6P4INB6_DROKI|nr:uncharacterized protein LOC108075883 [Drosophila kikkawai]